MKKNSATNRRKTFRILVANGANLDLLGQREPDIYGDINLTTLEAEMARFAEDLGEDNGLQIELAQMQTNSEAEYLAVLGKGWDGAILNPGAWTHTSLALADRLVGLRLPFIEVHLSNIHAREAFRQKSWCAPHALGVVSGLGIYSYKGALLALVGILKERQ